MSNRKVAVGLCYDTYGGQTYLALSENLVTNQILMQDIDSGDLAHFSHSGILLSKGGVRNPHPLDVRGHLKFPGKRKPNGTNRRTT